MEEKSFEAAVVRMVEKRTVRNYSDERIPEQVLEQILQAGINAASGGNLQPLLIIVERDKEHIHQLSQFLKYPFIKNADTPLLFLLDWHKLTTYSRCRQASFAQNRSTNQIL